jgi:hypothetical protein
MADLKNCKVYKNDQFEILSHDGFRDFHGIMQGANDERIDFMLSGGMKLSCTPKHKIMISATQWRYAKDLNVGDVVYGNNLIQNKVCRLTPDTVYEFLEIAGDHTYLVNNILCHQCLILDELAFIEPPSIMEDFWRSVWPTISRSKKSKVLIASTPNGTDNLFYKLYDGSMRGENSFVTSIIKWNDVPGRDEEWKKEQIKILGSVESFEQEFNCTFLQKGESSIDAELFEKFKNMCSDAILSLQDGKYKIWKMPQDHRIYMAGVDVAEGVGQDYSVIQMLDITDLTNIEQVACFRSNTIDVPNFTTQLHEILTQWGKPLAMIERNNCGAQVVDNLHHIHKYENIINYGSALAGRKKEQMGVVAHTNTKHKGVLNMRYWVNELQCVRFNDVNTIQELKEFVRKPNGTWSARGSSKDDCVMSLIWALMALDNDANNGICQRYFEILNVDDNGKPSAIKCMDFGLKYYTRPVHSALSVHAQDADSIASICFGNDSMQSDEMQDLVSAGWQLMQ